jgi:glycosyltransferase involved in cell wall biosynthesis
MRIVIDMQGAQTESRFRGIGRYTLSFAQAIVRNRGEHEIFLALSGLFPDAIEPIRTAFDGLLSQENVRVWHAPGPVQEGIPGNEVRREVAELIREAFLASLAPDIIHISSLFEGYVDDAVTSIGRFDHNTPVSVSLYDLIPLLNPDHYLKPNPQYSTYYQRKIDHLKKAELYLAISESTRQEGLEHLNVTDDCIVNVSTAIESSFRPLSIDGDVATQLRQKFDLNRPFVLYAGGADERKNLPRLIQAYAALHAPLRDGHQLLFAGKMPEGNIAEFKCLAKSAGLKPNELCFTGHVTDEELVQLYNLCKLFVFPSWHEGFGLPALEAMACGAPVIGANTSSLPEVVALKAALFDPFDVTAITTKMRQALEDDAFRAMLRDHGLAQARRFSWDESAKRAIEGWESQLRCHESSTSYVDRTLSSPRLIQALAKILSVSEVAPLATISACLAQNQNAGIERQLMLDVSELCQHDSATGVQRVVRSYMKSLLQSPPSGFRIEPVYATRDEDYRYARQFTQRFLGQDTEHLNDDPVQWQRGDLFLGLDMQHHVQLAHTAFYRQLRLEGVTVKFLVYDLLPIQLAGLFKDANAKELHEQWLAMIATTDGAICISQSTADAYNSWINENLICRSPNFHMEWVHIGGDIEGSMPSQGLPTDAQIQLKAIRNRRSFLCVATLEPRKGQQQILEALQQLWEDGLDVNLVLVGQQGWKVEALAEAIRNHSEYGQRLFWLQGISDEYLEQVYSASTCLIAASINEGFGLPLIEAARYGIPIVARDIPVFREVAGDSAFYFAGESPCDLASALETWLSLHREGGHPKVDQLRWSTWEESTEKLKTALVQNHYPRRQLLVDVSELAQHDAKSGIQRVVRSILTEWLHHPPMGFRVEPVYATLDHGYRYARRFTRNFLGYADETLQDEPIDYVPGDVFFGLDLQPQVVLAQRAFYQALRRQGVRVTFAVYDLLCVLMPQYFPDGAADGFCHWLDVVAENDGAICISKAVAGELTDWVNVKKPIRKIPFTIEWFHLGADIGNSVPTNCLSDDTGTVLERLRSCNSFLIVGTIEPRKANAQVLDAFEQLWQSGVDINLVIVGKQGWMVEALIDRLRRHPEQHKHLFLLEGISDEYLELVYEVSTCLIAASFGEGFGLPLIEAAQHKLPIIARDIPVFREVAGEHAFYFSGLYAENLSNSIKEWLNLDKDSKAPQSIDLPWLTWEQSAKQLLAKIILHQQEVRVKEC